MSTSGTSDEMTRFFAETGGGREGANLAWLLAERIMRMATGFLVGIFVARHLGPDGFGRLNYTLSCLALIGFLVPLGLDTIAKREMIASPDRVNRVLVTVLGVRAAALALTLVVGAGVALVFPANDRLIFVAAGGALLVPFVTSFDLVLEARLSGKIAFTAKLLPTFGSTIVRLILLGFGAPVEAFAFAVSIEAILLLVALTRSMRRLGVEFPPKVFEPRLAKRLLAESWPLILTGLAITIYGRIDLVMLRFYLDETTVGQYAAAVRLSELSYILPVLLASTFFPALVEAQKLHVGLFRQRAQRFLDLNALIAFLSAGVLCGGASWWVTLAYGSAYSPARPLLALHAWSAVFVYLGVARGHILTAERKTMIQMVSTGIGALTNISLNAWLIPRAGAIGAVWATLVAQATAVWFVLSLSSGSRWVFCQVTLSVLLPITWLRYLRPPSARSNH